MVIHVYAKTTEDITGFEDIIKTIRAADDEVFVTIESKRSFRELENIKNDLDKDTIIVISSLAVLGTPAGTPGLGSTAISVHECCSRAK